MPEIVDLSEFQTVRVTLDITVRRATRDHPASWNFHQMLEMDDVNDTLTVVSVEDLPVDQRAALALTETVPPALPEGYVMSAAMRAFLKAEIANERHGGVAPATLESADDSLFQADIGDLLPEELHAGVTNDEIDREMALLRNHYDAGTSLRDVLRNHPVPQEA